MYFLGFSMKKEGVKAQIFINECSLQGQFQTIENFEQSVKEFISVFNLINQNNQLNKELYKNEIFMGYEAIKNTPFQKSLNQLKDKSLKTAFTNLIFSKLNPIDWRSQKLHKENDNYDLVTPSQSVTNTSVAEITERKLQKSEIAFLLVNFLYSEFTNEHSTFSLCQLITVVKNKTEGVNLDCLDNKAAFEQWVQDKLDSRNFLEKNTDKFKRTSFIYDGATVYVETDTGNYWYLDNLHKNHFEVFNKQGEHLGEADLDGRLNQEKKDAGKKFSI